MYAAFTYSFRRAWAELRNEVFVLPSRTLVLVWVAALLVLPFVYDDAYVLRILTMTCIFAIFAADKAVTLGRVKPLHSPRRHVRISP